MRLQVANVYTRVADATDDERSWLIEFLAFDDPTAFHRGAAHDKIRLFDILKSTFPTGFLPQVYTRAKVEGYPVEIEDLRVAPCQPDPTADIEWLRHHPHALIDPIVHQTDALLRAVAKKRGILWLPTGAGKTEIGIGLTRALPCRWAFIVGSGDLLHQTAERYEKRTGDRAGRIGDGVWDIEENFTVAMFQTLSARSHTDEAKEFFDLREGVIFDEAHTLPAHSFWRVAMKFKAAYFRFGMSATPLARGDKRSVLTIAATGPVIYRVRADVLIKAGIISQPKIVFVPVVHPATDKPTWQGVYGECIVRSTQRNRLVLDVIRRAAKPALVFVKELPHGKTIAQLASRARQKVEFVSGKASVSTRQAAIARLERGDIDTIVSTVIFQQGIDIPSLASVVIASGGKSVIAALQKIGRGMRRSAGKSTFEVWDFKDSGHKWLEKHTRARISAYTLEGYPISLEDPQALTNSKLPRK